MTKKAKMLSFDSVEELDSEDRVRVLGIIDQFRELGVNEDVSLPQLVVVGDQSSGKSSLLEGITGLNFPIASELCTRFATQIVLRRDVDSSVKVSILPGPSTNDNEEQRSRLLAFSRRLEGASLSAESFAEILDEASVCMGLPSSTALDFSDLPKRFSDDVLKIELSGPDHHHLSVVDVPGLFHNPTKFQTLEDLEVIRSLLQTYLVDRRTIILAVMDARNNLANQEVFRMARAADPEGKRTVGIVTKCDAVQAGDEDGVLKIASNSVESLTHGWFAVRNRSTKEILEGVDLAQRNLNEKRFFNSSPWNKLPKTRTGIASLKKFLGKLLYDHIREEFPALVEELRKLVAESRSILETLGAPRQTSVQQRQFLARLAEKYQALVTDCLRGGYAPTWSAEDSRKLRMHLHTQNEAFGKRMSKEGHKYAFEKLNPEEDTWHNTNGEDIYKWIRSSYRQSRGSELHGTINPALLETLFRQQASPWRELARKHLETVDGLVYDFNRNIWPDVVSDVSIKEKLQGLNTAAARDARLDALKQLDQVLLDELEGILQTVNHYYADNVAAARLERMRSRFRDIGLEEGNYNTPDFAKILSAAQLSNEEQAVLDIHDTLKAYYKVALKRFSDNVVQQCVERYYVGRGGPVKTISPARIGELTDKELADMAAENFATSSKRTDTSQRLARLEKALELAESERI